MAKQGGICRLCKGRVYGNRSQHEKKCRGSALANRTCSKCGKVFPDPGEGLLSRPLGNHERLCKGQPPEGQEGANMVGAAVEAKAKPRAKPKAEPKAKPKAKAMPKAKAAAKGKGKAKAKGKAKPVPKAKGKARA